MWWQSKTWMNSVAGACVSVAILLGGSPAVVAADAAAPIAAADNAAANEGLVTTESGLQYKDVAIGTGEVVKIGTKVKVYYTGWLQNADGSVGKIFDSNEDGNEPFRFMVGMGRVIPGWDEGLQGMRIGGKRVLMIPAALGYGERGAGTAIPPDTNLIFRVKLVE
jgi:FKBP-type peptidyl-prolyl cis-trans isomerase FkpA